MTVTYGFYDSLAGDRKYNAKQMSQLFKGIITDGVFQTIGSGFSVTPQSAMVLNVGAGRAWFNDTWTDNDAIITVNVLASEAALNRIDTVVIEVNNDTAVRVNSIKVIKGTPATTPVAPTLANTATLHQYGIANVYVAAGVTSIVLGNITSLVGTPATPFVSGAIPTYDFGPLLVSWQASFSTWFTNLVNQLTGVQVTNLQAQIDTLNAIVAKIDNYKIVPSITTNNLVFDLKTLAGTNPTAGDPCRFKVGDIVYTLTAAVTFTKNAATNWMNMGSLELANNAVDLFVYAIGETGGSAGLKFGYSRIPWATTMGDFVNVTTDPKYIAGNWTNFNSTDSVQVIGRFRAQLSGVGTYNWSIATQKVINRPIYRTGWLNYSPQLTASSVQPVLGNGTAVGRYRIDEGKMWINFLIVAGSTTTFGTGTYSYSMPFLLPTYTSGNQIISAYCYDSSAAQFFVGVYNGTQIFTHGASTVGNASPVTFATGDQIGEATGVFNIQPA